MALKKSQLYSSLWQSCDALRGGMDASQYKDYVLTVLFMKYVSDKYAGDRHALIEIPKGGGFADMVRLKEHKDIGDKINKIIGKLAEANDLKGVIDQADFNDDDKLGHGSDMQNRLAKLVAIFEGLDFGGNRAEGDDLLGDAYEYLMKNFATQSGRAKGQFYTPAEVSRVMARVIGIEDARSLRKPTVYDPTCGSGSLLIRAANVAGAPNLAIYGQEMDNATWGLARMNMILHECPTAELWQGNTLAAPHFKTPDGGLKTFDFAVANPPFSLKAWSSGLDPAHDIFGRFELGIPPDKNGDYAFLLHLVKSLKSKGKGAIILPHGVLFRGNREAGIRRRLLHQGIVKGIVGLPPNLFFGTSIPACIVVLDKEDAGARKGVFMIDASKGFRKDGAKNRLRARDIHKIVDTFTRFLEIPGYSRMVPMSEIASPANECNLNIPRYIDSGETQDLQDLDAHVNGGIPARDIDALSEYWEVFPTLRKALFKRGRRGYANLRVESAEVRALVLGHEEFHDFSESAMRTFRKWRKAHESMLEGLAPGARPKEIIRAISEDLLKRFAGTPLIDQYAVYQRLVDYWDETMQDDTHMIAADGWTESARPRILVATKGKKLSETPDLVVARKKYKMDLIPPALVEARYFPEMKQSLESVESEMEAVAAEIDEYIEEHSGEDGLLAAAHNDKGKVTKAAINMRLGQLDPVQEDLFAESAGNDERMDERRALERCLVLLEAEDEIKKGAKAARKNLDELALGKYGDLSEKEIKSLVVEDKWMVAVRAAVEAETRTTVRRLAGRVAELAGRYEKTLPELEREVGAFAKKVEKHLKKMGVARHG